MTQPPIRLAPGDTAPWFHAKSNNNPRFAFDTMGGRYIFLTFVKSASQPASRATIAAIAQQLGPALDDTNACWFIVTTDPLDEKPGALPLRVPGIRAFYDTDGAVAALYGIAPERTAPLTVLLSPRMLVLGVVAESNAERHASILQTGLSRQVPLPHLSQVFGPAPIMIIPNVLEPELCKTLIEGYRQHGGEISGFMREENGKTVPKYDTSHKVRRDWNIEDDSLIKAIQARVLRRVIPEVKKAYNFQITRMERYIVACYDSAEGGHFRAHRDNTTKGTAHRRFACSINLNADEFEGGNLRFPEFGPQTYRPPTGGCVIFGCSLLHEATPVTQGQRFAFLPFFYDDAAARIRQANMGFIEEDTTRQSPRRQAGMVEPAGTSQPAHGGMDEPVSSGMDESVAPAVVAAAQMKSAKTRRKTGSAKAAS